MFKSLISSALVVLLPISFCNAASAAVIYDESIDGDAPSTAGSALVGANVGTLGLGENEILAFHDNEFDDFIFDVAAPLTLVSVVFSSVDGVLGPNNNGDWNANLWGYAGGASILSSLNILTLPAGGSVSAFGLALPLGAGTYRIDMDDFGGVSQNYSWTLATRASVPAPATFALFGLGLVGVGWSRRKKA